MIRIYRCSIVLAAVALTNIVGEVPAQQTLRDVTIVLSSASLGPAAPRVARELGLFEKHGLNAKIIPMDSANTALAAVVSKTADAGMIGSGTLINARARGLDIVIIANGYAGFATTMVLSKVAAEKLGVSPDAPVAQRLKAADGLTIATPEATASSTIGFRRAGATVGATYRFTYMAQTAMQAALETGAIDGYLASAPFWAAPIASGKGVVWISGPRGELPTGSVNTSSTQLQMLRDRAEAEPQLARAFAAVFADFRKAIDERPTEVKAAVARVFPNLDAKLLDIVYPSESMAWNARPLTVQDMIVELDFVRGSGMQIPNIDSIDTASLLLFR
jgi:ABC-type nitrate/sulfonate/bicarbonate transport system substrate-binding protein